MSDTKKPQPRRAVKKRMPPPCTPFELVMLARLFEPNEPGKAYKRAIAMLRKAQAYIEDPTELDDYYTSFADRLADTSTFIVHLPLGDQESHDQFAALAKRYEVKLPAKRETRLKYCIEWWDIEEERELQTLQLAKFHPVVIPRWSGDGSAPERLPESAALRLLFYCLSRYERTSSEARGKFVSCVQQVDKLLSAHQKKQKRLKLGLDR